MKKIAASVFMALLLAFSPTAFADGSEGPPDPDLFYTESYAETIPDVDRGMHPVVWVFVAAGVASVAAVGVLTYVNRRQKSQNADDKTIYKK